MGIFYLGKGLPEPALHLIGVPRLNLNMHMKQVHFRNFTGYVLLIGILIPASIGLIYSLFFFSFVLSIISVILIFAVIIWLFCDLYKISEKCKNLCIEAEILSNHYLKMQADEALITKEQFKELLLRINSES